MHGFKHGALRLWCCTINFVGKHNLRKERTLAKLKVATGWRLHHNGGAGDIGRHEIRSELDAPKFQLQRLRQTANQQSLAKPRHSFQERMATSKEAHQDAIDDFFVTNDRFLYLFFDAIVVGAESSNESFGLLWVGHRFLSSVRIVSRRGLPRNFR